jgi:hypothetical protein
VKRLALPSILALALAAAPASADSGSAPAKLDFWSGGKGAQAHWQNDPADSTADDNTQDIEIVTTADGGYAGFEVRHVEGTPTAAYPSSSFEVKSDYNGPSFGSPRLVVRFSDGGSATLRPNGDNTTSWQTVGDGNWDNSGGTCGFLYQTNWSTVQGCHAGTTVTSVFMVADPYGHTHWIDNLNTAGVVFSDARANGS